MRDRYQMWIVLFLVNAVTSTHCVDAQWRTVSLHQTIDSVAPWTGIVLWTDHDQVNTNAIQLEYRYMSYDAVAVAPDVYDWTDVEEILDQVAGRGHQAILRFHFVYPGRRTTVPMHIKRMPGYVETQATIEGLNTSLVDWSHAAIEKFVLDFYREFAKRYDDDSRLAYLQTGFGLWAEYHLYSGPHRLGETFPSKSFQEKFFRHMDRVFQRTPWMVSVDAADSDYSPLEDNPGLLAIHFGLFDDSFLCESHPAENALNWRFFGTNRWKHSPGGGEFSYYTGKDQRLALSANGPNGRSFESAAAEFHITFMIGNDQPGFQTMDRIREAGMATGYRLKVTNFETTEKKSRVTITNVGTAPIYFDAFVAVAGVRASESLRGLLPGDFRTFQMVHDGEPTLTIESDRLVDGQRIPFAADLP